MENKAMSRLKNSPLATKVIHIDSITLSQMTDHTNNTSMKNVTAEPAAVVVSSLNSLNVVDDVGQNGKSCNCSSLAEKLGMDAARLSKFSTLCVGLSASLAITFSMFLVKLAVYLNPADMASIKFAVQ